MGGFYRFPFSGETRLLFQQATHDLDSSPELASLFFFLPFLGSLSTNDPRKVATLVGMGFTEQQAKDALDGCSGNVERAAPRRDGKSDKFPQLGALLHPFFGWEGSPTK